MGYPYECWVCGARIVQGEHPKGWKDKPIAGGVHTLCDSCAPHAALSDGLAGQIRAQIQQRHGIRLDENGEIIETCS